MTPTCRSLFPPQICYVLAATLSVPHSCATSHLFALSFTNDISNPTIPQLEIPNKDVVKSLRRLRDHLRQPKDLRRPHEILTQTPLPPVPEATATPPTPPTTSTQPKNPYPFTKHPKRKTKMVHHPIFRISSCTRGASWTCPLRGDVEGE